MNLFEDQRERERELQLESEKERERENLKQLDGKVKKKLLSV